MKIIATHEAQPGDLVFCDGRGIVAWSIRMGQRFRRDWNKAKDRTGDRYNHVAILDKQNSDGDWTLLQAVTKGVVQDHHNNPSRLSHYSHYVIVTCPADRERTIRFARSQVGHKYGYLTTACFIFTFLSPKFLNVMVPRTWICSALAAESLRFGGWFHDWSDIYQVSPAQLWCALERTK